MSLIINARPSAAGSETSEGRNGPAFILTYHIGEEIGEKRFESTSRAHAFAHGARWAHECFSDVVTKGNVDAARKAWNFVDLRFPKKVNRPGQGPENTQIVKRSPSNSNRYMAWWDNVAERLRAPVTYLDEVIPRVVPDVRISAREDTYSSKRGRKTGANVETLESIHDAEFGDKDERGMHVVLTICIISRNTSTVADENAVLDVKTVWSGKGVAAFERYATRNKFTSGRWLAFADGVETFMKALLSKIRELDKTNEYKLERVHYEVSGT